MLSSMHPLGERTRSNRWATTAAFYVAGGTLGGIAIGTLMGALGSIGLQWWDRSTTSTLSAVLTVVVVALIADAVGIGFPTMQRQVNEDWLTMYRSWVYGGGFGFQLGLAVVTIITSATTHAMLALSFLSASPSQGLIIGGAFGLARTLPILTVRSVNSGDRLRSYHRAMNRFAPRADWLAKGSLIAAGLSVGVTL